MKPCEIKNIEIVRRQLENNKDWAANRDVTLRVRGRDNNIRVEALSKFKDKAIGVLNDIKIAINDQFSISKDLIKDIKSTAGGYYYNIKFTPKALNEMDEIAQRNAGTVKTKEREEKKEVTVRQLEILFPENEVNKVENINDHIKEVVKNINENLPREIANSIEVIGEVPKEIVGNSNMYFSMKKIFNEKGITDEFLINWFGINLSSNLSRKKAIHSINSKAEITELVEKSYNNLKNLNDPILENKDIKESFDNWVKALKNYPVVFKDLMLKHAIKHLRNPEKRSKFILQLSTVALQQTYGIAVNKPHELNRIGKIYDSEVLKTVSDAVGHEPSASGRGYWVHIPRTKGKSVAYRSVIRDNTNDLSAPAKFTVEYTRDTDLNFEIEFFDTIEAAEKFVEKLESYSGNDEQFKANVELLRKLSPSTWCTASGMAAHYVENYDNYLLIVDGITVAGIEVYPSSETNRIKAKFERNEDGSTYEKSFESDEELQGYVEETGEQYTILQRKSDKRKVKEVTSRGNNSVASIDHLDDTIAFFEKHNLDLDNKTIKKAIAARDKGKTDDDLIKNVYEDEIDDGYYYEDNYQDRYINEDYFYGAYSDAELEQQLEDHASFSVSLRESTTVEQVLDAIDQYSRVQDVSVYDELNPIFKSDYRVAKAMVAHLAYSITKIDPSLPFYIELTQEAINNDGDVYNYISEEAKQDPRNIALYNAHMEEINLPFSKTNSKLIQGYYDPKTDKVVVIASNTPANEASKVAIHEVAHRGMLRMAKDLGGDDELFAVLKSAQKQLMEKLPELLKRTGHTSLDNLMLDYGFNKNSKEGEFKLLQELSARWAETLINKPKPMWWKKLLQNIGTWIKKFTGRNLTENEVNELVGGFVKYGVNENNSDKIEELFKLVPKLSNTGTIEQYINYLNTIFSNNVVVFQGGDKIKKSVGQNLKFGEGFYFSEDLNYTLNFGKTNVVLLDKDKVLEFDTKLDFYKAVSNFHNISNLPNSEQQKQYVDEITKENIIFIKNSGVTNEYIVNNENFFIELGSEQDLERFKNFVESKQTNQNTNNQTFFNLNEADSKRKTSLNQLNNLLKKTLSNLKVEVLDPITGKIVLKSITIKNLKNYKSWYEKKYPGETFDAIGAANILDAILTYSEDDGITLPEEALHFIMEIIYDTPEVQELLNITDENGIKVFEKTPIYQENYSKYLEVYGSPDIVHKELLAKLIAQYMYDVRVENSLSNKILKLLDKIFNLFFKRIRKNIAKYPDLKEYPIELRKALGIIDSKLVNYEYINNVTNSVVKYSPSNINPSNKTPAQNLQTITKNIEELVKRLDQLIKNSPNTGKDWKEFKKLFVELNMTESPDDGVHNLDYKRISQFKENIVTKLQSNPSDQDLINDLQKISKLEKYFNTFAKTRQDVEQMYSYEFRIAKVKKFLNLKQYEEGINIFLFGLGNIKDKEYGADYDYNQYGAIYDMYKAFSKMSKFYSVVDPTTGEVIDGIPELVRSEHIAEFTELLKLYSPIIDIIDSSYRLKNNTLFENDDKRNEKVGEALRLMKYYRESLNNFLTDPNTHYHARRNAALDIVTTSNAEGVLEDIVAKSNSMLYTELTSIKLWQGQYNAAGEGHLRVFMQKIKSILSRIDIKNTKIATEINNELVALGYNDLKLSEVVKTFYELDDKGVPTGYALTERDMGEWVKNKKAFSKTIPQALQEFVKTHPNPEVRKIYIPTDYNELLNKFIPIYSLEKLDKKDISPELKALWLVRDQYSSLWGSWHSENSEQFSKEEAEEYLANIKNKTSLYHYNKIYNASVKEYTRSDGSTVTYYTGALSRPKKINPQWAKLSGKQKKLTKAYAAILAAYKLKELPEKFTQEYLTRVPQVSKNDVDIIVGKNKRVAIIDRIKSNFVTRIDDDYYNRNELNQIVKIPPVRYNSKLEDPRLLTGDVLRGLVMYTSSVNTRNEFMPEILGLQGMLDMVLHGEVTASTSTINAIKSFFTKTPLKTKSGEGSNIAKAMETALDVNVFGDSIDKNMFSTFLINSKKYITAVRLSYNPTSIITSSASAEIDKKISAAVNDIFNSEELAAGQKRFRKDFINILKDFENPVKKTVLGSLAISMSIGNNVIENFSNTNISKTARRVIGVIKPFSGWNSAEMVQSLPLIAAMGESIRLIDGHWVTRQSYLKPGVDNINKRKKKWKAADKIIDRVKVKEGVVEFEGVPDNIVELYYIRTKGAVSQMSQALTPADKGVMHRHSFFNIFTAQLTWMLLQYDNMFGDKVYDLERDQFREGYVNRETFIYMKDIMKASIFDIINSARKQAISKENLEVLLDYHNDPTNELKLRNVKKVFLLMGTVSALSFISYILASMALYDEEDDELSYFTQIVALVAMKVLLEQRSKISLIDFYEYTMNPSTNVDSGFDQFQALDYLYERVFSEKEDNIYKKDNIFKGMDKETVQLIRSTPYINGIFQNYLGWWLNPKLGGSLDGEVRDQLKAFKSKRDVIKNKVLESSGKRGEVMRNLFGLSALPSQILGYTLGENFGQLLGNPYHKNSTTFNTKLPTSKASEAD